MQHMKYEKWLSCARLSCVFWGQKARRCSFLNSTNNVAVLICSRSRGIVITGAADCAPQLLCRTPPGFLIHTCAKPFPIEVGAVVKTARGHGICLHHGAPIYSLEEQLSDTPTTSQLHFLCEATKHHLSPWRRMDRHVKPSGLPSTRSTRMRIPRATGTERKWRWGRSSGHLPKFSRPESEKELVPGLRTMAHTRASAKLLQGKHGESVV